MSHTPEGAFLCAAAESDSEGPTSAMAETLIPAALETQLPSDSTVSADPGEPNEEGEITVSDFAATTPTAATPTPVDVADTAADGENPNGFAGFGLRPDLLEGLARIGFRDPTPIQRAAIPDLMLGRDLLGQAQTGTGKTAAFGLPLLHRLDPTARTPQVLILTPTRELALQVC
ncbi:MAG: DEAD/DEAH box helicase, partial [Cyanobium sp.]